ncbi:hypothetical protein PTKIN_Ptkin10aG0072200 [Pterospermum kingtungense]
MNTLVRNATSNFSRRVDGYELLDQNNETREENIGGGHPYRTFSKKRAQSMVASLSYRRDRAKKRQIFLRSYKLSTVGDNWKQPKTQSQSRKLKKMVVKVKTVAVSAVVSFMRIGSFKSCNCRSGICAASPISIRKCS